MDFSSFIKDIRRHRLICLFHGKKYLIRKIYQQQVGKQLDLENISTFREKLQLRKLCYHPLILQCVDKHAVREYVKNKIGAEYLIPELIYTKKISVDDLKSLPKSFALKCTSGSGTNIIIKNKDKEDLASLRDKINNFTKIKHGYLWGEFFYNKIPNQIIAEKLISDDDIDDYKIHCFRDSTGKLRQIVEVLWGPKSDRHKKMFDTNWKPLPYYFSLPPETRTIKKPSQLDELLSLADKLSENFSYVRVDFYLIKDHIYFGELTFVPTAGFGTFKPPKYDEIWGSWIDEKIILKENI